MGFSLTGLRRICQLRSNPILLVFDPYKLWVSLHWMDVRRVYRAVMILPPLPAHWCSWDLGWGICMLKIDPYLSQYLFW